VADWALRTLGEPAGALEFGALLAPLVLALLLALRARAPANAAEFDGRKGELSPWGVGLSLAASDLALAAALILLPLSASAPYGGLVCLQGLVIGGVLGRWMVSRWLLPACFAARERGVLAAIEERLGRRAGALVAAVFSGGALLATTGRVFLFVFALQLSIGARLPGGWAGFGLIALGVWAIAALLALVRGLRGSIAGDGFLLLVLLAAAVAGLAGLVGQLDGHWGRFFDALRGSRKHIPLDIAASPGLEHTFWTALFVSSLASAAHYGADPVQLTRLLATGSLARARKALWVSLAGVLPALVLCLVGAGLLAWTEQVLANAGSVPSVGIRDETRWPAIVAERLPSWSRALLLAGFAVSAVLAAKSLLAALLQLAAARRGRRSGDPSLRWMRGATLALALLLLAFGMAMGPWIAARPSVLDGLYRAGECALGLVFAAAALALLRRPPAAEGLFWAAPLALVGVMLLATRGPRAILAAELFAAGYVLSWAAWRFLPDWFGHRRRAGALVELAAVAAAGALLVWGVRWGLTPIEPHFRYDTEWVWLPLSPAWYVPTGGWIGFVFGCLLARGSAGS
jgi:hypothetical protein